MWSIGVLTYCFLTAEFPFDDEDNDVDAIRKRILT
jgi:serine/threonine protein kinase